MPVPPPEPFVPFRYSIDGQPASIGASHAEWTRAAQHLHQLAADMMTSVNSVRFEGPEAQLWRERVQLKAEALTEAATGIQTAGEGLGDWGRALAAAQQRMLPVEAAAQLAHTNVVRAFTRVNTAESVFAAAEVGLAAAEAELSAATAAAAASLGTGTAAVAAASAHVAQATAEFTRAATEVGAALADHAGWFGKWNAANTEADAIQGELGADAATASSTVQRGNAREANVQGLLTQSNPGQHQAQSAFSQAQSTAGQVQSAVSEVQNAVSSAPQSTGGPDSGSNQNDSAGDDDSAGADDQPSSQQSQPDATTDTSSDQNQGGVGAGAAGAAGGAAAGAKAGKDKQKSSKVGEPEPADEDDEDQPEMQDDQEDDDSILDNLSIGELGELLAEQLVGSVLK